MCRDNFTVVGNLGELILEVIDVRLEDAALSYFNSEEVVVILLGFLAGDVLGEKRLSYLLKIIKRMRWQRVKPIRDHNFQTGRKR